MNKIELTQEIVKELLHYDPETGHLYWKERDIKWFAGKDHHPEKIMRGWNTRYKNKEALAHLNDDGYKTGNILYKFSFAHRIIWLWNFGGPIPKELDHKNKIKTDNRLENLFSSNRSENLKNKGKYKNNTSGITGVLFDKKKEHWCPNICVDGKRIWGKRTKNLEEAIQTRRNLELKYGYTND